MIARKCTPQELFRRLNTLTGGGLVKLIEIRRSSGVLLIGRKGELPKTMLKASDQQSAKATLKVLEQDREAIGQLRAQWRQVFPGRSPEHLAPGQIARMLYDVIGSGAVDLVLLRDTNMPIEPANITPDTFQIINVGTTTRRLIITRLGALPTDLHGYRDPTGAISVLNNLSDGDTTAVQLNLQAHRLDPIGQPAFTGKTLRLQLAQKIGSGVLDAAVITQAAAAGILASRPDAIRPVSEMTVDERIGEALKRCVPYAIATGGEAVAQAVKNLVQPESIAVIIGLLSAVALANTNPWTGAAVDGGLVLLAWYNGGKTAIEALGAIAIATLDAQQATTEAELEQAARAYGEALGKLAPDLIMKIIGRFVPKKGGKSDKSGKASVQSKPGPAKMDGPKAKPAPKPTRSAPPQPQRKAPPTNKAPTHRPQHFFDDLAKKSTRNPDSDTMVLGKFNEGGKSYTKVAAHHKATYFKMENWKQTTAGMSNDEIWKINESFLKQQIQQGKNIVLSHDPAKATGFYAREVEFMKSLGYQFKQENWVWKAVRP